MKVIFQSNNISGTDIEQSVKTITKLKDNLKEFENVSDRNK